MRELKPCPFCGREAHLQNEFNNNIDSCRIICDSCFCSTDRYWCEDEAVTAWNARSETEAEEKIKEVREKLNLLKKDARLLDNECECVAIDYVTDCLIEILEGEK